MIKSFFYNTFFSIIVIAFVGCSSKIVSDTEEGYIPHSEPASYSSDSSANDPNISLSKSEPNSANKDEDLEEKDTNQLLIKASKQDLDPEEAKELLGELGNSWFYGEGLGKTTLTVGTIALFPPYAIYVLANSILELTIDESFYVSELLPEEDKKDFDFFYSTVTSVPGKFAASIAGKEFRSKEVVKERIKPFIKDAPKT